MPRKKKDEASIEAPAPPPRIRKKPTPSRQKTYTKNEEWLIKQLRQISINWPPKEHCLNRAYKGPGRYQCAGCLQFFKHRYELKADHVDPVVDPHEGYVGKGIFAERLFVEEDEAWQALCAPCHQIKTNEENAIRREASKARLAKGEP